MLNQDGQILYAAATLSFLKDQAIFADSQHLRKKAVIELIQSCPEKQAAIVILSEIIDSCPDTGDGDFKQFFLQLPDGKY